MEDIVPELLASIEREFNSKFDSDELLAELAAKLEAGTATHLEAYQYAGRVGTILTDVYRANLSTDSLPDGKLWYNIANRVITPTMQNNYEIVSKYVTDVQTSLNKAAGIGIKALKSELNTDRIDGIINKVSNADNYKDVEWVLDAPVKTFSQSIVDSSIKANVDFHGKSGLVPKIIRKTSGSNKCCEWCQALAGIYRYPDVPKDVYRRHENCDCIIEYDPGNGKRQNVHTKQWQKGYESDKINSTGESRHYRNYAKADGYFNYADVVPKPRISPDEIINDLETSSIGREILEYIQHTGIKPKLIYTPRFDGVRGDQFGTEIRIFMSNISSPTVAAQTIIHEVTHFRYNIGGCQWAEAVCMANEKRHIVGRNQLTNNELKYIVSLARNAYPEFQWKKGGYNGDRHF